MPTVAFDSTWFLRRSNVSPFKALLGVSITVNDKEEFRNIYDRAIDNCFEKYGVEKKKNIYKAAHLTDQVLDKTTNLIKDFIHLVSESIREINVYYTFYPTNFTGEIITCRDSYPRPYKPEKFMNLIFNAYPHYCVWKYFKINRQLQDYNFEVDYFHGKITPAWREIQELPNLRLYFNGDQCNKLISTADLILRYINNTMPGRLGLMNLTRCLREIIGDTDLRSHFMGPRVDYLNAMAFDDYIDIDTRAYISRPIYWILWRGYTGSSEEKKVLEWNPIYNEIMTLVEEVGGCARLYEHKDIPHLLNPEMDKICIVNNMAEPYLRSIQSIAPEVEIIDFRR